MIEWYWVVRCGGGGRNLESKTSRSLAASAILRGNIMDALF